MNKVLNPDCYNIWMQTLSPSFKLEWTGCVRTHEEALTMLRCLTECNEREQKGAVTRTFFFTVNGGNNG